MVMRYRSTSRDSCTSLMLRSCLPCSVPPHLSRSNIPTSRGIIGQSVESDSRCVARSCPSRSRLIVVQLDQGFWPSDWMA
ncbi:hypothetical protein DL95DRAFT_8562 [Leptodontidium sp. 2 PMI_412]|nr:hypothetical protein DL95DRAFT_8562 [Leptodontidium sp. 2 PMI_412]